ncbi:NADH-quinone oxidoreductase subunit G [Acidithiobacillus caldus]|uniref:NADH-quinone oxidoreductase n=1 Tax=Acidithiobacillus caldus (strain SM-1) TaxID=990288 RepID=F9ZSL1_ACICS|nr:NADH-quinone oxidoreductase subunit NuoG [Acidithiobacillus caldus]AEK59191.1 NADH-ubiquinone oxidoreductase chain G [Acidithiobacillus caldus SM-1]AUW33577.1 NADH-quinone oxidoreductase subunit G [Acidithiobacillus caldus]QER43824.1 NADH dehydrogenase I chain G [Acidithiobacillus caldus]
MPHIEIDGRELDVAAGTTILEAARQLGIYIPVFCYHPKLSIAANCRMCLVDVEKQWKPLPACATPCADGMKIQTRSAKAKAAQQGVLEFLLINHPLDCPVCDQGGECPLQDITMGYANPHSFYQEEKRVVADKDIGPLIATEMTRCIQCTRCVRFGQEIGGIMELGVVGRGEKEAISTYVAKAVSSELSGNMIDLCPVGALTSKPFRYKARSWELKHTPSLCPHCSTGCNTDVQSLGKDVLRVLPRANESVNEEWICDKGRFAYAGLAASDRGQTPLLRVNGSLQPASWAEALEVAAAGLEHLIQKHGPQAIAALISPNSSNEELFLFQALFRALGVVHIEHRLRQTDFRADAAMPLYPALNMSLEDLERERTVLLCHAFPREQQPLTNHRLRKAALAGAEIYAINTVLREFNFPVQGIFSETGNDLGLYQRLEELLRGATAQSHEGALARLATALRTAKDPLLLIGNDALQHPRAAELLLAIQRVAALAGARTGWLANAANAAGAWLLGCVPQRRPGGASVAGDRSPTWSDTHKGFVLYGVEPTYDSLDAEAARHALGQAEFVLALGHFTGHLPDSVQVFLPLASWAESAGSFINNEGRLQHYRAAVAPVGEARPGWKVLRVLADHLGIAGLAFNDLEEVQAAWHGTLGDFPLDVPAFGTFPELAMAAAEPLPEGDLRLLGDWTIYTADPLVRRASPLRRRAACRMHPDDIAARGLGSVVELQRAGGALVALPLLADAGIPRGSVWLPLGTAESVALGGVAGSCAVGRAARRQAV